MPAKLFSLHLLLDYAFNYEIPTVIKYFCHPGLIPQNT